MMQSGRSMRLLVMGLLAVLLVRPLSMKAASPKANRSFAQRTLVPRAHPKAFPESWGRERVATTFNDSTKK